MMTNAHHTGMTGTPTVSAAPHPAITRAMAMFAAAGLDFVEVDRCPSPGCDSCADHQLSAAA